MPAELLAESVQNALVPPEHADSDEGGSGSRSSPATPDATSTTSAAATGLVILCTAAPWHARWLAIFPRCLYRGASPTRTGPGWSCTRRGNSPRATGGNAACTPQVGNNRHGGQARHHECLAQRATWAAAKCSSRRHRSLGPMVQRAACDESLAPSKFALSTEAHDRRGA